MNAVGNVHLMKFLIEIDVSVRPDLGRHANHITTQVIATGHSSVME